MRFFVPIFIFVTVFILSTETGFAGTSKSKVVPANDIQWGLLNPLRGELSPKAVNLWGDRTKNNATGMLVKFNKGFSSPPHIHNVSYRGIVIDGLLHNALPSAPNDWMGVGAFWTQPAGGNHITAANADTNLIYLEIDSGPYLVKPSPSQFDNGERALNLHHTNMVWLDSGDLEMIAADGVDVSLLWRNNGNETGYLLKLKPGFSGKIISKSSVLRAVLISEKLTYTSVEQSKVDLTPGSYFESTDDLSHEVTNPSQSDALLYVRSNESFSVK